MNGIRRIVLDILKPHEPKITDMALKLTSLSNIDGVNITVYEIDKETENVKVTIEGNNLDFDEIQEIIESLGGTIHSIDEVVAGKKIIEELEHHKIKKKKKKKKEALATKGARWGRGAHDIMTDKEAQPVRQKYGAFIHQRPALITLSAPGSRQVASGSLSEMIQNNWSDQEARAV